MRDPLAEGIALFNTGRYFEAHEAFEELWRVSAGDLRMVYQGVVQACAGLVKHQRGEPASARTLIQKGLGRLHAAPAGCRPGFDLTEMIRDFEDILRSLEAQVSFPAPHLRAEGDL